MAIFSTHILNSVDGTHFSDIYIKLVRFEGDDKKEVVFYEKTDEGGRLKVSFNSKSEVECEYEVQVFLPTDFYNTNEVEMIKKNISMSYFSIRVFFHQNDHTYHIPFIVSPYGLSCWISS